MIVSTVAAPEVVPAENEPSALARRIYRIDPIRGG